MTDIDYTIAAKPTMYNGRLYRSRLEARWACFFDLLGWTVEYEPCDLGGWSPDFALRVGKGRKLLIEVKPIDGWHRKTARKMADALQDIGDDEANRMGFCGMVMLLGEEPRLSCDLPAVGWIGWLGGKYEAEWSLRPFWKHLNGDFDVTLEINVPGIEQLPLVKPALGGSLADSYDALALTALWKQAANTVQWLPGAKRS